MVENAMTTDLTIPPNWQGRTRDGRSARVIKISVILCEKDGTELAQEYPSSGRLAKEDHPLDLMLPDPGLRDEWPTDAKYQWHDLVQKKGRTKWRGKVVGWYRTDLTALGYAVESVFETGSVQIYPETGLMDWDGQFANDHLTAVVVHHVEGSKP